MTTIHAPDHIVATVRYAYAQAADAVSLVEVDTGRRVWVNAVFAHDLELLASSESTIDPTGNLSLAQARWEQFRADGVGFSITQSVGSGENARFLLITVWQLRDVTPRLAVAIHRRVQTKGWARHVSEWIDDWAQPALLVDQDGVVNHVNLSLRSMLTGSDQPLAPAITDRIAACVRPVLDADTPRHVDLPTTTGRSVGAMLGRFHEVTVLKPGARIVSGFYSDPPAPLVVRDDATITTREWDVIELLCRGERVRGIATHLFLAENTVRNHLRAIFAKTGVTSQAELIDRFRRQ